MRNRIRMHRYSDAHYEANIPAQRYVLYARKSTEQDERQTQSLESQKVRSFELAARNGVQIVEVYEESRSAKEPGRTVFNEVLRRVDAGEIDGIIAWHPDRLARNELDAAAIVYRLRKGVLKDLLFFEYTFINSPEGIMMLQMALSQSQYQVSKLSIEVTRGIEDKLALGWYPHRAPLGYVNDKHLLKGQKSISTDPERFSLLQQAWQLLLTGTHSVEEVRGILNDSWGFRTPITSSGRGGAPLARATFYNLLGNPFYAGQFYHGGHLYRGAHPPMVTMDEFEAVQRLLRREVRGAESPDGKDAASPVIKASQLPFTGLIRCGYCGSQITVSVKTKPSGKTYTYYHCSNSRGGCSRKGIREDRLQAMIDVYLERIEIDDDFYEWAREIVITQSNTLLARQEEQQAQRKRAIDEVQKRLDTLLDIKLNSLISDEEFRSRRESLIWERNRLVREMELGYQGSDSCREACLNAVEYMRQARNWLAKGQRAAKRVVSRNLVSNWTLQDGKLLPELHPLLVRVSEEYPALRLEKSRIELLSFGSESKKREALSAIKSKWSAIWDANRTLTESGIRFPNVIEQCLLLGAERKEWA